MISKRINPQVYVYLCMYILEDYHFVCNDRNKLTYFGAEFETECDVSACLYGYFITDLFCRFITVRAGTVLIMMAVLVVRSTIFNESCSESELAARPWRRNLRIQ